MMNDFCRQIDEKMLIEEYVAGRLKGDILKSFEEHLEKCETHARAVSLEKALKRGITEYARSDIKTKLQKRLGKQNDTRFLLLRYAAILLVGVISPLLIYYQFNVVPQNIYDFKTATKHEIYKEESVKQAVSSQPEKSVDADDEVIEKIQKKSRSIASGRGGSPDAPPAEKSIPPTSYRKKTVEEEKSVESEDIANMVAEEPSTSLTSDMAFSRARPGSMQQISSISKDLSNLSADMHERTLRDSARLKDCIEAHLESEYRPEYFLLCTVQVMKSGEIGLIEVKDAFLRSEELEECLITIMKTWMISTSKEEQEIEYKISYKMINVNH